MGAHTDDRIVIVGAGHAGGALALALREQGHVGSLTLIGAEPEPPYERPSLSKELLLGKHTAPQYVAPAERWAALNVVLRLGVPVAALHRAAREVALADGSRVPFDACVLATGGSARPLPFPPHPALFVLRTADDSARLRAIALRARRAVVVGGGVIGLEVASSLRTLGLAVAVVEAGPRLLGRNVPEEPAAWLAALQIEHGVALHLGRTVAALTPEGSGLVAVLDDGTALPADLVVAGIGLVPETRLATEAGLPGPQGVVVGPGQQTADPAVLAIGDVALRSPGEGLPAVRQESWAHAQSSAARAARTLLGLPHGVEDVPWFWTAQHGSTLQLAGEMTEADAVVARGERVRLYLRQGRLWGAACLDAVRDFAAARRLLATRPALDRTRAADPGVDLRKAMVG